MYTHDEPTIDDYRALAEFRYQIRRFLHFSEQAARAQGLEPQQHQLLLALKGLPEGRPATIGNLAERLQIHHHSAVELVDRLVEGGLVERSRSEADRRQVLVRLAPRGEAVLRDLSLHHHAELRSVGPALARALGVLSSQPGDSETGEAPVSPASEPGRYSGRERERPQQGRIE